MGRSLKGWVLRPRPVAGTAGSPTRAAGLLCVWMVCAPLWAGAAAPADQEPLAAGQMLVKFAAGGAADSEITRLHASGETGSAALDAYVQTLAAALDVPLFVRGITAGREAILEIERSAVLEQAAGRLREAPGVKRVAVDRVGGAQRYWRDRLVIEPVPGSDLAQGAQADAEGTYVQNLLATRLSHRHYVVAARPAPPEIELRIDLQATTLNVINALKSRAGIEYAQPNFVVTIN